MNNGYDDIERFLHTNIDQQTKNVSATINQNMQPLALTQEQLIAQNARLIQQLQQQQRMIQIQNMFTQMQHQQQPPKVQTQPKKTKIERITSTASLKETTAIPIQDIKGNVKNAYIKKITSLLSVEGEQLLEDDDLQEDLQDDSSSLESNYGQQKLHGLLGSQNDLFSLDAKSKRLRKSAKKSRLRKKVYLKLLEKKVSDLDSKIQQYKQGTKQSFEYLTQLLQSNPILNNMIIGNSNAIDQILNAPPDQAQLVLDSYLMRYGISGIKRRDYLKYAVKNIQRNLLKGNYGLLLLTNEQESKGYDEEFNSYVEKVKTMMRLEDENLTYKILPTIDKLLSHRTNTKKYYFEIQKILRLLLKLNQDMKQLKQVSNEIEESITQFTSQLTPIQFVELIKLIEKDGNYNRGIKKDI